MPLSAITKFSTDMKKLGRLVIPLLAILVVLVNVAIIKSSVLGISASIIYLVCLSFLLGKVLLRGEPDAFARFLYGFFLVICVDILVATPIVVVYTLNFMTLAIILSAPLILAVLSKILRKQKEPKSALETPSEHNRPHFSLAYIGFFALIGFCLYLLIEARTGWVYGTVWTVVPPVFFVAYLLAGFSLVEIILYSKTKATSKLLLIIVYASLSTVVFAIVLYPGPGGDPFRHLAFARLMFNYGNLRRGHSITPFLAYWLVKEKALPLMVGIVAKIFVVDVYWIHTFIVPIMFGVFVPLTAYKIAETIGGGERAALLSAFLTLSFWAFSEWGSISTGNSLGLVPFFIALFFTLRYVKRDHGLSLPLIIICIASLLSHPFTGLMSFIFLFLAIGLRMYKPIRAKSVLRAYVFILVLFLFGISALPAFFGINNLIYWLFLPEHAAEEANTAFSLERLLGTDIWTLVFGQYMNFSFKEVVLYGVLPFLGVVGLIYAWTRREHKGEGGIEILFMLLAFIICIVVYRILEYAMVKVPFGPGRIWAFRDLIAIPFAALAVTFFIEFFGGGYKRNVLKQESTFKRRVVRFSLRNVVACLFIGLAISALVTSSIERGYSERGLHPTQIEADAVMYIDEHTNGRYVVLTVPRTAVIGEGFVGAWNPEKYYVYSYFYSGDYPSIADMELQIGRFEAEVGYFIASSFATPNFNKVLSEASRIYDVFKILRSENGAEVYIFRYKIPPVPTTPDVMAFHWDIPPSYYIQNDLVRVIFNPATKSLDVRDFWGYFYEGIDLDKTLVNGEPLGNVTSIEYYNPTSDAWVNWVPDEEVPFHEIPALAQQFSFRLCFETDSLIGVVERGKPFVQLYWESGQAASLSLKVGGFKRLYIPGLVDGKDSYNVSSRQYGLLYTLSRTENVLLHPAYKYDINGSSLTLSQITAYGGLTTTTGYLYYDMFVHNTATMDQWAYVEIWLPDAIYPGIAPPLSYSLDEGKTWTDVNSGPTSITTLRGVEVSWITQWGKATEEPATINFFRYGDGGDPRLNLPGNFTNSGGGQNRLLLGVYLPADDKVLLRLGVSIHYVRPLKITYIFEDSDHIYYGLGNMKENLVKVYNYGTSEYVGGLDFTQRPAYLAITEDESGKINSMLIEILPNTSFSLFSERKIDTTIDNDGDGIPDNIKQ